MKRIHKIIILLIGAAALLGALRNWYLVKTGKEITVDGHQVSLLPCKSVMNELFGSGIDSVNICKCLIPKFYQLIKDDPVKIQRFKEVGFFKVEGKSYDSAILFLRDCAVTNLLDTNYKIRLGQYLKPSMISRFKDQFESEIPPNTIQFEDYMKCVFENIDGKITIKEYFADDYSANEKITIIARNCLQAQVKPSQ